MNDQQNLISGEYLPANFGESTEEVEVVIKEKKEEYLIADVVVVEESP